MDVRLMLSLAISVLKAVIAFVVLWSRAESLGDVGAGRAVPMVLAAMAEATPRVPAELVVALAWGESRFEPTAEPACGAMQVYPRDLGQPASSCAAWRRDLRAGVRAGVLEIETMLADQRVHGDLARALLYRACGNAAFAEGCTSAGWVRAALARARGLSWAGV